MIGHLRSSSDRIGLVLVYIILNIKSTDSFCFTYMRVFVYGICHV